MHILESYFEIGGHDHKLIKGGISVYAWNLAREFTRRGHKVSILTAAHGQIDYLRDRYGATPLPYKDSYRLPLELDPAIWHDFSSPLELPLTTRAYGMSVDGIDFYYLSNEYLDLFPDSYYPPYDSKGRDLGFFKPLVFQVDCIRFIRSFFGNERMIVHLHEPYYHYLMPAALRELPNKIVVATVQSNMPINKKVYRPKVERLLAFLETDVDLNAFKDRPDDDDCLARCMAQYMPRTHLHYNYRTDYIALYSLVAAHSDLIDFLSPGQQRFYSTFRDTPFEQLFQRLTVAQVVRATAHKQFVGWCGISPAWREARRESVNRAEVLARLGLDPRLTTFYHNARYAPHHKGQVELMMSIDQVLTEGLPANFIIRCISGTGIGNPYFHAIKARFPGQVHLEWLNASEHTLIEYACASDFALFPSKFEMDTFLIAQGEAMACGVVPIATTQEGMSHFNHALPIDHPQATGFSLPRSFREDDALLVDALAERIREAVALHRDDRPTYDRLAANARCIASRFSWDLAAEAHLSAFADASSTKDRGSGAFEQFGSGLDAVPTETSRNDPTPSPSTECCTVYDNGSLLVNYRSADAVQVDIFSSDESRNGGFCSTPMAVEGESFRARLDRSPGNKELYLLIAFKDGRVTWDKIRYG